MCAFVCVCVFMHLGISCGWSQKGSYIWLGVWTCYSKRDWLTSGFVVFGWCMCVSLSAYCLVYVLAPHSQEHPIQELIPQAKHVFFLTLLHTTPGPTLPRYLLRVALPPFGLRLGVTWLSHRRILPLLCLGFISCGPSAGIKCSQSLVVDLFLYILISFTSAWKLPRQWGHHNGSGKECLWK